jgi:hypothetical protein
VISNRYFAVGCKNSKLMKHLLSSGPLRESDFEHLCRTYVSAAGKRCMEKYIDQKYPIGWVEIVEELCNILVERFGFTHLDPEESHKLTTVIFKGSWTITDNYPPAKDDLLLGEVRIELAHFNDTTLWDCSQAVS